MVCSFFISMNSTFALSFWLTECSLNYNYNTKLTSKLTVIAFKLFEVIIISCLNNIIDANIEIESVFVHVKKYCGTKRVV